MSHAGFNSKFMGAMLPATTVSRIEMELSRRTAAGTTTSRAKLIIEAVDKAFPLPNDQTTSAQTDVVSA